MSTDPFAELVDDTPLSPAEALRSLLTSVKREYCPVRNSFVQRPPGSADRSASLASFVTNRQERALDAILTAYALQPVLSDDDPLPLGAWANIFSTRKPCGLTTVSKTFRVLEEMGLVTRRRRGHTTIITPLLEDGTGRPWSKPGLQSDESAEGGYFTIPHEYWTDGYIDRLRLPGKAMLLIMLKETQGKPPFEMAVDRAQKWYGISERTAERGYAELSAEKLLDIHIQRVASPRLPKGVLRERYHRALRDPFSTVRRRDLQLEARKQSTPRKGGK
ncbi:hypothetical protein JWS13_04385 (plasmid) [Rhodococcus pseudokoreensis]|uniref:Helix-turn-helix domain-containing protein n=1 Tax=Rhodococcus pseudokoreensis TaxID=2811421 RepID=A0A974VZK1_9NOCA|nr:hypothetical protein [Rhodococcus pseudokoreensis]QSE87952.1 hypothetical protein JWS13_04385 [Rhodococcus pseudokoreensis]